MAAIDNAEYPMPQLPRWLLPFRQLPPPTRRRHHDEPVLEEDQKPLGCGWFDSSHELQRGLHVVEIPMRAARHATAPA